MSLQVWLPLNGNLENKGLDEITFSQTTVAGYETGKIGQALQILNSNVFFTVPSLTDAKVFSVAFWYKAIEDSSITTNWRRVLSFDTKNTDGTAGSLFRFESSYAVANYALSVHNSTSQSLGSIGHAIIASFGEWHHVCFTHTPEQNLTYLDGVLKTTGTGAAGSINGTIRISDTSAGTDPKGLINDLRIYDHCLSPKEIKELSKGLVAHYPLNDGIGEENILSVTPKTHTATAYNAYQFNLSENLVAGQTYTIQFWDVDVSHASKSAADLGVDVYWGGGSVRLYWWHGTNYFTNGHADHLQATFTVTEANASGSGATNKWLNIYNSVGYVAADMNLEIGKWKLEKGSIATPWIPAKSDALYSELGLDEGVVYDCSGYERNGTMSSDPPSVSSDSPRYLVSSIFNGSTNFIMLGRGAMVRDAITVSWWGRMDTWSSYGRAISCTEGGGWNFEPASGKMNFAVGTGESSNTYKSVATSTTILTTLSAGWHMFTGTYDGLASKIYVDGVLQGTTNAYTTKTPLFYNASNGIFIGAEAASTTTTPTTPYFNGKLSDVRIYATALSADNIKELYETSASVDNHGNIYGYEIQEA